MPAVPMGASGPAPRPLNPPRDPLLPLVAAAAAAMFALLLIIGASPRLLALPTAALIGVLAFRRPDIAVIAMMLVAGFQGTLTALTPVPVGSSIDLILVILWGSALLSFAAGSPERQTWLWPGMLGLVAYLLVTVPAILLSDSVDEALRSFRGSGWLLASAVLVALAPWSRQTYTRIAAGVAVTAIAVGGYSLLRYLIGPAGAEEDLARGIAFASGLPGSTELRFFGSFPSANSLSAFVATLTPFCLALALGSRTRLASAALLGGSLCAFAVIASDVRTGLLATLIGMATTLVVFSGSQSFPGGRRIARSTAAVIGAAIIGGGAFFATVGSDEAGVERYERVIADPGADASYEARLARWESAIAAAREQPFGYGLGSQGAIGAQRDEGVVGTPNLDSSYLKIGIEQGLVVMGLFIAALIGLLGFLAGHASRTASRFAATVASGACGTLAAAMILFYAGLYIEGAQILPAWILIGLGIAPAATRRLGGLGDDSPGGSPAGDVSG